MCSSRADRNPARFTSDTCVANIDIIIACSELDTGGDRGDVVATARLVKEGVNFVRDVVVAGCVVAECTVADRCVVVAIAASERESSDCRVAAAS